MSYIPPQTQKTWFRQRHIVLHPIIPQGNLPIAHILHLRSFFHQNRYSRFPNDLFGGFGLRMWPQIFKIIFKKAIYDRNILIIQSLVVNSWKNKVALTKKVHDRHFGQKHSKNTQGSFSLPPKSFPTATISQNREIGQKTTHILFFSFYQSPPFPKKNDKTLIRKAQQTKLWTLTFCFISGTPTFPTLEFFGRSEKTCIHDRPESTSCASHLAID